jgi:hypothetical protein
MATSVAEPVAARKPRLNKILRDILSCRLDEIDNRTPEWPGPVDIKYEAATERLQAVAAQTLADLNGWRIAGRSFAPDTLGMCHSAADRRAELFESLDHCIYFRESVRPYRTVAMATQPYGNAEHMGCYSEEARGRGHLMHIPPGGLYASIWFPGSTMFGVMTKPGVTVLWLPEQQRLSGFEEHLKLERALIQKRRAGR